MKLRHASLATLLALSLTACEKRSEEAPPAEPEEQGVPASTWNGLEVRLGHEIHVGGKKVTNGAYPADASSQGKMKVVLPGLAGDLVEGGHGTAAKRGVLLRVDPATPYVRVGRALHTLQKNGTPATHFAAGENDPIALTSELGDPVFLTINSRGVTVTAAGAVMPPLEGCPPGATVCFKQPGEIGKLASAASIAMRKGDTQESAIVAGKAAELLDVPALRKQIAAAAEAAPESKTLSVVAHSFVPAGVLATAISANCKSASTAAKCERIIPNVYLTLVQ